LEHLGWWSAAAMLVSILLHVAVFFALDRMKFAVNLQHQRELLTQSVNTKQVSVRPMDAEESLPPEEIVQPPKDSASLLEEIDLLAKLPKEAEIDIRPDIKEPQYALQMQRPAAEGDPAAIAMEVSSSLEVDTDLPELGRQPEHLKPAEVGQVTVDPGAVQTDDNDLGKFTDALIKQGANGKVEKGALDGIASLDDLLDLPPNILLDKKTMLPGDLLFEFNSAELRESAKVGLMKLGLLMDRNPSLYCWIEGHCDLVGGDEFNLNLSIRRSEAVKKHLTESLRMDPSKISTRGFGRYEPILIAGTTEEQAVNRRVEIRMRKAPPTTDQLKIVPKKASVVEEAPALKPEEVQTPPPKAVWVKPKPTLPVEVDPVVPRARPVPPEAVEPPPSVPKALPVEPLPAVQRALPVDDEE
jgi:OOP family OmpA-OmpF porin